MNIFRWCMFWNRHRSKFLMGVVTQYKKNMTAQGADITCVLCLVCFFCAERKSWHRFHHAVYFFCACYWCGWALQHDTFRLHCWLVDNRGGWLRSCSNSFGTNSMEWIRMFCALPRLVSFPSQKKTKTSSLGWIFVRLLENMAIGKPTLRLRHRHTLSKTCNEQHVSSTGVLKLEHLPQRFKSSKVWNVSQDFNQFNVHETISATDKFLLSCWNS